MKTVKVTGHPRLYRRGGRYYHRAAIPQDIRETYPKTEETFSLKTSDYQEALRRVRQSAAEVDRRFADHRKRAAFQVKALQTLSDDQISRISAEYYASLLTEDDEIRTEGFYEEEAGEPNTEWERWDFDEKVEALEDDLASLRFEYARGRVNTFFLSEAEDVLTWDSIDLALAQDSPSLKKLARGLQEAYLRAGQDKQKRNLGEVIPTPPASPRLSGALTAQQDNGCGPLLSVAAEDWMAEKSRTWTMKTANDHRTTISNFITIVGDKPLDAYGKADGRAFKAVLLRLPASWSKQKTLHGLIIDRAAERAHELGMAPMSDKNVNKLIGYAAAFWNWATSHYDNCPANPLTGLKIKLKQRARDERDPFTLTELQTIFQAPLFTGCKSLRFWRQQGSIVPRDSGMFWAPLISLYSGARMGEVLQLYTADIKQEEGITYLDINGNGDDKSLKTASSWRLIPVHPELVRLGFLKQVERMRQRGSQRLFPDMPMGKDGYYSSVYSKRFRQLLDVLGIKHSKNAFHSFRHNFEDACRASGISKEVMDALQGHAESGMSARYGTGFELVSTLNEAMTKLSYRNLKLNHLYQ